MFDFLRQRFAKTQPDEVSLANEKKQARQAATHEARQAAVLQAEQLSGDEAEAMVFVLENSFADARLIAAQHIYSRALMEQVRHAMRDTDRRVTRLMQTRLDELSRREKQQNRFQECLEAAERLKQASPLLPNQVAELDRQWSAITKNEVDDRDIVQQYESLRKAIDSRLAEQTALQRQVIDSVDALNRIGDEEAALSPDERAARLAVIVTATEAWHASLEWPSLPRQLQASLEETLESLTNRTAAHQQAYEAYRAREALLVQWESMDWPELTSGEMRSSWQSLPAIDPARLEPLQVRFEALVAHPGNNKPDVARQDKGEPKREEPLTEKLSPSEMTSLFTYSLTLMQKAIQDGVVREATQQNDKIAQMDLTAFEQSEEQKVLLAELRAELKNLVGWAKWSGNMSREELIRMMEELPAQDFPIEDLAAAVVDAREKWKALNAVSGMASKNQWQQFDAACNRAYEPVMEYAKSQAVMRDQNMQKAQALLESVRESLSTLDLQSSEEESRETDWRSLVDYQRRTLRAWQQIGPITRKEKKRLDGEFEVAIRSLTELLKEQTRIEIEKRNHLIEEVRKLNPEDRNAGRAARALQERWQERARAFPLDNREDQKLWEQFRGACEAIFSHRAKLNEVVEAERLKHLHEKEKICVLLEAESAQTAEAILQAMKKADAGWRSAGDVPKEHEESIQKRYDSAVNVLLTRMRKIQREEKNRHLEVFIERLAICRELEHAIPDQQAAINGLKARWETILSDGLVSLLTPRFESAMQALLEKNTAYAAVLQSNQDDLMTQLLRLEIALSVDSPPEWAAQRRQIQMEALKDALSGNRNMSPGDQLASLCVMPVLTDDASAKRLITLIRKMNDMNEGPALS